MIFRRRMVSLLSFFRLPMTPPPKANMESRFLVGGLLLFVLGLINLVI
jgi:hypothetical protein